MKTHIGVIARRVAAVVALLLVGGAALSQNASPPAAPPPSSAPAGGAAASPYIMTMGDMMNTLIQPRHAKLGLAVQTQNWPLASYAVAEIRQAFAGIVKAQPKFAGMPVGELVDVAINPPLKALDAAIKQQDAKKLAAAYAQLTQGCNACHMELDHPYVVIKTPDASAFPNQDFAPKQ
jgi:cytochrome c556